MAVPKFRKRFERLIALTALSLALGSFPLAADCLRVSVLDPDGRAVTAAKVAVGALTKQTGRSGDVSFCGLPAGAHEVDVKAPNFEPVSTRTAAGQSEIEIRLVLPGRVETPIVVTGEIEPRRLAEVDRSLVVLSVSDPEVPAWTFPDVLKQDASVDMRERGSDGTQADISIRGSTFDQVLVLINGVRVSDAQTGHHSMNLPLPFEAVEQVEILHGSGATMYGSDAVGGTVNFVTRKPSAASLRLMGGVGEHGWNRSSAAGGFRLGNWSQHFSVARDFSTGFDEGRDFRNLAFSSETYYDSSFGSTTVMFAANDRPFGANNFYGPWNSWEKTGAKFLSVSQSVGRNTSGLRHRFNFAFRRNNDFFLLCKSGCVFGGRQFLPEDFLNIHQTNVYQGNYGVTGAIGERARWSAGGQYLSEGIDSTVAGVRRRERAATYLIFDLRPSERLTLSVGLRYEVWRKWRGEPSPTFSAGYWLGRGFKLRGQIGRAFRMPTYTDLYHRDPGNVGNSALVPETAWNYELGLDWYSPSADNHFSAAWFQRREKNTIDWVKDNGSPVFQARNFQALEFTGGEFEFSRRFRRTSRIAASFTVMRASRRLPVDAISRYVFNYPREQFAASYSGPLGKHLLVKTRLGVYTRQWQTAKPLWDVMLKGSLGGRWEPFIQGTNLLDTEHEAFRGLRQPDRSIRGGLQLRVF